MNALMLAASNGYPACVSILATGGVDMREVNCVSYMCCCSCKTARGFVMTSGIGRKNSAHAGRFNWAS